MDPPPQARYRTVLSPPGKFLHATPLSLSLSFAGYFIRWFTLSPHSCPCRPCGDFDIHTHDSPNTLCSQSSLPPSNDPFLGPRSALPSHLGFVVSTTSPPTQTDARYKKWTNEWTNAFWFWGFMLIRWSNHKDVHPNTIQIAKNWKPSKWPTDWLCECVIST